MKTRWGKVAAMGQTDGERWYMFVDKRGVVSLMPADTVEEPEPHERGVHE